MRMTAVEPERIEGYQLSPQQQAAYLREGARNRAERSVCCPSRIAPGPLAARLAALVEEHEILRTRYVAVPGLRQPVQVVDAAGPVDVEPGPLGSTQLRAGELTVEHTESPDGTLLRLGLPRLSVDRTTWSLITGFLLGEAPGTVTRSPRRSGCSTPTSPAGSPTSSPRRSPPRRRSRRRGRRRRPTPGPRSRSSRPPACPTPTPSPRRSP